MPNFNAQIFDVDTTVKHYMVMSVVDRILEHLYRRWIEGGVYTAPFTDGGLHLGDRGQPFVERLYIIKVLLDTGMRHASRHQ